MKYKEVLSKDPIMKSLIEKYGELTLTENTDYFVHLISGIIGQLLSGKAADTIFNRVKVLCGGAVTPETICAAADESLRAAGSSYSKIRCMKALAQAVIDKTVDLEHIKQYDSEEVIRQLTVIKGIGRWTAEMFLVFCLAREDVFSFGDGGLNNAMKRLYGNGTALNKSEMKTITDTWQPYRSYASLYLWRSLDNK